MRQIFLKILAILFVAYSGAQNVDISGTVTDSESGFPVPGVNILVQNTSKGAATDFDGNFTITDVEVGAMLVFSYVGYVTQEIVVTSSQNLNISLAPDLSSLDEVVVVGYGTQKKSVVTGAISSVKAEDLQGLPLERVEQALQG